MIPIFDVVNNYTADGTLSAYSFDFKIFDPTQILVVVLDNTGLEIERVRGDDTTFLNGVTFDANNGGGVVNLLVNLTNLYQIYIYLAPNAPVQTSMFRDKLSFTLRSFEDALDYLTIAVQRATWLAQRSLRLNDVASGAGIDVELPAVLAANSMIMTGPTGLNFINGPTPQQIQQSLVSVAACAASAAAALVSENNAATSATAAAASATAAATSATAAAVSATAAAASATAAAASAAAALVTGFTSTGPFAVTQNTNSDLAGEITDHTVLTMVEYRAKITRGTTVFALAKFAIFYRNGGWEIAIDQDLYAPAAVAHGVTFTVDATTAQINAAVDNSGAGNASISLKKISIA